MSKRRFGRLVLPFVSAAHRFGAAIPTLAAALLLLLLGMFAARALRTITERLLSAARLDEHTAKVGINEVLSRLGLGKSPSYVLAFVVYWFILFIFIVSAANAVNMTIVSDLLERFVLFLPQLVAALLILFGGMLFGHFLAEIVSNAAAANNIPGGRSPGPRRLRGGALCSRPRRRWSSSDTDHVDHLGAGDRLGLGRARRRHRFRPRRPQGRRGHHPGLLRPPRSR